MKRLLILTLLPLFAGCSINEALARTSDILKDNRSNIVQLGEKATKIAGAVSSVTEKVATKIGPAIDLLGDKIASMQAAAKAADTDGDGKLSLGELWKLFLGGGSGAAGMAFIASRRRREDMQAIQERNAASDARKTQGEARLALLENIVATGGVAPNNV